MTDIQMNELERQANGIPLDFSEEGCEECLGLKENMHIGFEMWGDCSAEMCEYHKCQNCGFIL